MTEQGAQDSRRQAVALAREQGMNGARVLARGYGELAEKIIAAAREHDIPVHDSPELVSLLLQLDLDQRLPPDLYRAVAELLCWLQDLADACKAE